MCFDACINIDEEERYETDVFDTHLSTHIYVIKT